MISIGGCNDASMSSLTVVLRGGTSHVVEEIERAFDDALGVVALVRSTGKIVVGGGSTFAQMAKHLRIYADGVAGRKQMAIHAYANALEEIPSTIAENAGMDPVEAIIRLRQSHSSGAMATFGINITDDDDDDLCADLYEKGVIEPFRVVEQAITSATETATMILRIDDVIQMKQAGPQGPMM